MSWIEEKVYENCAVYMNKVLSDMLSSDNLRELDLSEDEKGDFVQIMELCDRLKLDFDRLKKSGIDNITPLIRDKKINSILK
jgi:hypothetical protein